MQRKLLASFSGHGVLTKRNIIIIPVLAVYFKDYLCTGSLIVNGANSQEQVRGYRDELLRRQNALLPSNARCQTIGSKSG